MTNYDPALSAILADLRNLRHWCSNHPSQKMPPSAVKYLCANENTILCLIEQLKSTPIAERRALHSKYRELDENVIHDDCTVAITAAKMACKVATGLLVVTDDDVNMILRPIEYVKYIARDESCTPVVLSPIHLPS